MKTKEKKPLTVTINKKMFILEKPVWDLMIATSKERDYYRDIVKALEKLPNENN